ncbi:MAG TPA: hypothetical protein VJL83_00350 [Patescibacteria group bacterium]|nr:hypothetical protein [Patescibacteria group bacterium]
MSKAEIVIIGDELLKGTSNKEFSDFIRKMGSEDSQTSLTTRPVSFEVRPDGEGHTGVIKAGDLAQRPTIENPPQS